MMLSFPRGIVGAEALPHCEKVILVSPFAMAFFISQVIRKYLAAAGTQWN
jgi:hypothetical protein